jgi:hypothetical protein
MYDTLLLTKKRGIAVTGCGNAEAVKFIQLKLLMCTVLGTSHCFVFLMQNELLLSYTHTHTIISLAH